MAAGSSVRYSSCSINVHAKSNVRYGISVTATTPTTETRIDSIQVTGDATVDWMLIVPTVVTSGELQTTYQWEGRSAVRITAQPGGAALLSMLVEHAARLVHDDVRITGTAIPERELHDPNSDRYTRAYTIWQPFPVQPGARDLVWRQREFLGMRPGDTNELLTPGGDVGSPDCLVIDDANHGFRQLPAAWPACLREDGVAPRQVILKMSSPLASGPLWDVLASRFGDRLTLYCYIGDLRKEYAPIGQPLSWERIATDVTRAVRARADLVGAARVIVSIGLSGAVVVERDGGSALVYDPQHQEGDWERRRPGRPIGLGTCVAAALAVQATRDPVQPDWLQAIRCGLEAARDLHERRFVLSGGARADGMDFPALSVARVLADSAAGPVFRCVEIPQADDWHVFATSFDGGYRAMAARIVVEGDIDACRDLPVERMGAWSSIDRTEIESMRSVRNIIREHLQQTQRARPLSLAVFGPPGSGKSFAIKQMAREWMGGTTRIAVLEFNLSQFAAPSDLPAALQRVRDCAVEGMLPLVFWDEFDTPLGGHELGWLAQFLAPMQDGTFVEHGIARPIGPAIFIFAGGTHATMASFKRRAVEIPGAKATDFISRLRGYVDILGPNPTDGDDRTYVLRRALLLRALLLGKAPGLFRNNQLDIDPGVLRAFLDVTTYVHGARSMESIVDMSALSGKLRYERSALPPQHQLGLHVDAEEFLALVVGR
jgi:hypothetical protein